MSHFALRFRPFAIAIALFILVVSLLSALDRKLERVLNAAVSVPAAADGAIPSASLARVAKDYGKLPISFEANQGQTDKSVQFLARGAGYTLFLRPGEAVLSLHTPQANAGKPAGAVVPGTLRHTPKELPAATPASTVRLQLIGSNTTAEAKGVDPLPGKSNYLMGNDPAKWHTDVPTYAKVRYSNVYPRIDLVYYGNQEGRLEHDFVVAPGADPNQIVFELRDQDQMPALKDGGLNLRTKAGDLRLREPVAYQVIGGENRPVLASYVAANSGHVRFRVGDYDSHFPLVIDPVLAYSAVFGGSQEDWAAAIAVDAAGNVYVTGATSSSDFPLVDPYQSTPIESTPIGSGAAFVSKLNSSGTALLYSTYIGGGGTYPWAMAVDSSGRIYLSGQTQGNLPVVNAFQPTFIVGEVDAFISVLNASGNALEWSTYLGGPGWDSAIAMALDPSGNVYVTGYTLGGLPTLHSIVPHGTPGPWVAKFDRAGALQYSSIIIGSDNAESRALAADSKGSAYVTGFSRDPATPTTPGAFRSTCPVACTWVAKVSPAGDNLVYATTLGAGPLDGEAIAVDSDLNAYVGGTTGPGLPVWSTGFQRTFGGGTMDGFVVKLNATGSNLIWSTYLGGSGDDVILGIALDRYRQVYVIGYTCSPNFPLKASIQTFTGCPQGKPQAFVTTLSSSLGSIQYYSTYLGGPRIFYWGGRIAVDPALNVYVAGPDMTNVQPTPGAYSVGSSYMTQNNYKAFVSRLTIMDDLALALSASPNPVPNGSNLTYTIGVTSKGPDFGVNVRLSDTLPAGTTLVSYDAGGGTCSAPAPGSTGTLNCTLSQLNKGATWNVNLTVKVNAAAGTTLSNTAATISNMQDFVISNNSATITTRVN